MCVCLNSFLCCLFRSLAGMLLDANQTSKSINTTSTSLDRSAGAGPRQVVTDASYSITYSVVPRLINLVAEQSCTSYRPGVPPVTYSAPAVQQKPRVISKMQKASKLAAMMSRMKNGKSS